MALYYLVFDSAVLEQQIGPALQASRRQRTFEPCRPIAAALLSPEKAQERYWATRGDSLLDKVLRGLSFDRRFWKLLAGELLFSAAAEIPELQVPGETLCRLLAPEPRNEDLPARERFAPIHQACFGTRHLCFGPHCYRPDHAGYNDARDVSRLSDYLAAQRPEAWSVGDLAHLSDIANDEERAEELEFARYAFPDFQAMYQRASGRGQTIVCERL